MYGADDTRASLAVVRSLCATVFSDVDRQCPMDSCEYMYILPEVTVHSVTTSSIIMCSIS